MMAFLPPWRRWLLAAVLWCVLCLSAAAAGVTTLQVPPNQYAVLSFGQPVTKAVLPPNAPVAGKPYFMSHNHVFLVMLRPTKTPVQAIVQLADGTTRVLSLITKKGMPSRIDVPGTAPEHPTPSLPQVPPSPNPAAGVVPVFSAILTGKTPAGWTPVPPAGQTRHYDRLNAVPVAQWNGADGNRVVEFQLNAMRGKTSTLDPSQFYWKGVKATLLDNAVVGPHRTAHLWVLVENSDGD